MLNMIKPTPALGKEPPRIIQKTVLTLDVLIAVVVVILCVLSHSVMSDSL